MNNKFNDILIEVEDTYYIETYTNSSMNNFAIDSIYKNRPNLFRIQGLRHQLYKTGKLYKLNWSKCTDYYNKCFGPYLEEKLNIIERSFIVFYKEKSGRLSGCNLYIRSMNVYSKDEVFIVFKDDLILEDKLTKKEIKEKESLEKRQSEYEIVDKLLKGTVETIIAKYNMKLTSGICTFKDQSSFNKFVFDMLDKTVFDELRKNGFKIYKKSHRGKLSYCSPLFLLSDLGIETNHNN